MGIVKHIKEHGKLGVYGVGANLITVGSNGRFSTIDAALAYLAGLTGSSVMTDVTVSGTATATQNSDAVTGASTAFTTELRPNDYIALSGDGAGFVTGTLYYPIWSIQSATSLKLATGYVGTGAAGKTITVKRPVPYVLLLSAGEHQISVDVTLPSGINLTIVGASRTHTTLHVGGSIQYPRSCRISIDNMTVNSRDMLLDSATGIGVLDAGLGVISMTRLNAMTSIATPLSIMRCAVCRVHDIRGTCYGAIANIMADYIEVVDVDMEVWDGSSDVFTTQPYGAFMGTKDNIIRGLDVWRHLAATTGGGSILEINQGAFAAPTLTKNVRLSQVKIIDEDQQSDSDPGCIQIALTPANVYLDGVVLDNFGDAGRELRVDGANLVVYGNNVRNLDGSPVNLSLGSGTYYDMNCRGTQALAYAATLAPNANIGGTIVVGTLTGNVTAVSAPTNPLSGQKIRFIFTQDAGAGHTVAGWNAVYKVSTAVPGGATNGQKCVIGFEYDGANWIQDVVPVWV